VVNVIEQKFNTRKISELGGVAQKAPVLAILLVGIAFANIALPLTNSFVGEFMMFNGLFTSGVTTYNVIFTVLALISIILAAVYTLNMIKKVFYGNVSAAVSNGTDISFNVKLALSIIVLLIILLGVFPKPMLSVTDQLSDAILSKMYLKK
jgi:NADH-quinone oxidoreductase subunit M